MIAFESPRLIQNKLFSYRIRATHVHPEKDVSKFELFKSKSAFRYVYKIIVSSILFSLKHCFNESKIN